MRFTVRRASRSVSETGTRSRLVLVAEGEHFVPPPGSSVDVEAATDLLERTLLLVEQIPHRLDLAKVLERVQGRLQNMPAGDERIAVKGEADGPGTFGANFATAPEEGGGG